ncbi:MAG: hypothetical protein EAZ99_08320 [Alphaproteobacteria bacterium]|nr:MAG: hypothetical protein EAZ99_08320 [Alphaproteobacteria bacterium]
MILSSRPLQPARPGGVAAKAGFHVGDAPVKLGFDSVDLAIQRCLRGLQHGAGDPVTDHLALDHRCHGVAHGFGLGRCLGIAHAPLLVVYESIKED